MLHDNVDVKVAEETDQWKLLVPLASAQSRACSDPAAEVAAEEG